LVSWFAWLLVAGATEREALENIEDAIRAYLDTAKELVKNC